LHLEISLWFNAGTFHLDIYSKIDYSFGAIIHKSVTSTQFIKRYYHLKIILRHSYFPINFL
jgi:hypothetical protein